MSKAFIILAILLVILIIPVILLSTWGLSTIEKYAIENGSANWVWRVANIYTWSFREDWAVETYTNFMEHYASDPRYPEAKYRRALCLVKVQSYDRAIAEFKEFADWYPEHPNAEEARKKATLIKYTH